MHVAVTYGVCCSDVKSMLQRLGAYEESLGYM